MNTLDRRTLLYIILAILISAAVMVVPTFRSQGISSVKVDKEFTLPLILEDRKDIKLVFFGYSGCDDICTPHLNSIDKLYRRLTPAEQQRVGVEFVDISSPHDVTLPERFARFFNDSFKGIYLKSDEVRKYTRVFGVYFAPSLDGSGSIDHTASLYLVQKRDGRKYLRAIYSAYPYDETGILADIKELTNEKDS